MTKSKKKKLLKIDSSFQIHPDSRHLENNNHWGEVRIKKDSKRGDYYIDVLLGRKGEKQPHLHIGLNVDQTERFRKERGVFSHITRKVESKRYGLLENKTVHFRKSKGGANITFKVIIHGPTKTIRVLLEEAKIEKN